MLLRDNKQSGPYTLQEIIEKGIKAYDLVWAEGKSAAWRYPSEIEELKPFSPVVEEQPFDRFYRRNIAAEQTSSGDSANSSNAVVEKDSGLVSRPVEISQNNGTGKRKIFVTMPGGTKRDRRLETPVKAIDTGSFTDKDNKPVSESPALDASVDKQKPVEQSNNLSDHSNSTKAQQKETKSGSENSYYTAKSIKTIVEEAPDRFSSLFQENYSVQDEKYVDVIAAKTKPKSRVAARAMLATALLLGGVVIGLVISYYNQKSSARDLDALVKQIQDREKRLNNQSQQAALPAILPVDTQQVSAVSTNIEESLNAGKSSATQPSVIKKVSPQVAAADNAADKSATTQPTEKAPEQSKVATEKPAGKSDAAIESARKNIYSLVGVEGTKYKTGVLGGISDLKLTISNNSLYQLDRVEVEIRYFGPEKRVVKTQTLLFNDIPAGQQRTLEAPRSSRGVSVEYSIRFIDSKELGLAHSGF